MGSQHKRLHLPDSLWRFATLAAFIKHKSESEAAYTELQSSLKEVIQQQNIGFTAEASNFLAGLIASQMKIVVRNNGHIHVFLLPRESTAKADHLIFAEENGIRYYLKTLSEGGNAEVFHFFASPA